jgi:hypothetical protein
MIHFIWEAAQDVVGGVVGAVSGGVGGVGGVVGAAPKAVVAGVIDRYGGPSLWAISVAIVALSKFIWGFFCWTTFQFVLIFTFLT